MKRLVFLAKSKWEPVENLNKRDKADPKTKSTEAAKAGDEVQPGHLWQPLVFWSNKSDFDKVTNNTVYSWISKENVHYGNVVFIGIVVSAFLKKGLVLANVDYATMTLVSEVMSSLSSIDFGYFSLIGPVLWWT